MKKAGTILGIVLLGALIIVGIIAGIMFLGPMVRDKLASKQLEATPTATSTEVITKPSTETIKIAVVEKPTPTPFVEPAPAQPKSDTEIGISILLTKVASLENQATISAKQQSVSASTALPATPTATSVPCTTDELKYWNAFSFEIWPVGSNPGKAHWATWPDGTLVVVQGKEPKGDLPYGLLWDASTKTYSVSIETSYTVEWWNINTKAEEGIFSISGLLTPTDYTGTGKKPLVFHVWTGATDNFCRYDGDRITPAFADIPVYPQGNTLEQMKKLGVPVETHLMQYLIRNASIKDKECKPALIIVVITPTPTPTPNK